MPRKKGKMASPEKSCPAVKARQKVQEGHSNPSDASALAAAPGSLSEPSREFVRGIPAAVSRMGLKPGLKRSDLLPYLFRIKGKPYSLRDRPQFEVMFDSEMAPDMIVLSGRQLGKSISLSRSEVLDMVSIPQFQTLYVAPLQEQTRRYSDLYLTEAINSCDLAQALQSNRLLKGMSDSKIIDATGHKTFANGSGIQLTYAKTSADRARGIFADRIDFDEIQDQNVDAISIISESLTSSEYGARRFTGTAKTMDNTIQMLFERSSQCEWVMKCQACGTYNIPNIDGGVLKMIKADGMHCVHCGGKLDVRSGKWVAAYPSKMSTFRGYHIPQVVSPSITESARNWGRLLGKLENDSLTKFIQENLGISESTGQRLVTQADIVRQSTLPGIAEIQSHLDRYTMTVAGIDWGGAEHTSFTVISVIGCRPDGRLDVIYCQRFRGFDPDEQLESIARTVNFYGCAAVAADYGMGLSKNIILSKRFGLPMVQMMYTRQNKLFGVNPPTESAPAIWTIGKVQALDIFFLSLKNGRIFFPKDGFDIYTCDILADFEETTEAGGLTYRIYMRDPARPDDALHAMCFASVMAMKLMGQSIDDMIPDRSFNGGRADGVPVDTRVDGRDT